MIGISDDACILLKGNSTKAKVLFYECNRV